MKKPSERLTIKPQSANAQQPDFAIEFIAPEATPPAKKSGPKLIPPNAPPPAKKSNSKLIPPAATPPTRKSGALQLISPNSTPPAKKSSARLTPPSAPPSSNESEPLELIPPETTQPARKSGSMSAVKSSNSKRPAVGSASRSGERQKISTSKISPIAVGMIAGGLLLAGIGTWMITRKGKVNAPQETTLAAADKKDASEKLEKMDAPKDAALAEPAKKESAQNSLAAVEEPQLQIAQTRRKGADETSDAKNATSAPAGDKNTDKLTENNAPAAKERAEPATKDQPVVPQQIEISIPAEKETAPAEPRNKKDDLVDDIDAAADKKKKEQKSPTAPQENNPFKRPDAKMPEQAAKADPKQNNDFGKIGPAPQALCPVCAGTKHIPILPGKQYVWMQGEAEKPADAVPWKMCPKCQKDADPKALLQDETARLANHTARHQELKQGTKLDLVQSETPAVTLHSQLPAAMTKVVAQNLEDLRIHLQKTSGTTVLTPTRPDTHEIIIVKDTVAYNAYIDLLAKSNPGVDFALSRKASGSTGRNSSFYNANLGMRAPPPEHMALFQLGQMFLREATDGKAPAWLVEGFAAYGENAVTKKNLCYSFAYDFNEVKFGINWNADIKKFAKEGKLKPWAQVFPLELVGMKSLDYLTCYSVVCFLMNDPHRFVNFVNELRAGTNSTAALEKAYGQKIEALQNAWGAWTLR